MVHSDVTAVLSEFKVPCGVWLYCLSQKMTIKTQKRRQAKKTPSKKDHKEAHSVYTEIQSDTKRLQRQRRPQRGTQWWHRYANIPAKLYKTSIKTVKRKKNGSAPKKLKVKIESNYKETT